MTIVAAEKQDLEFILFPIFIWTFLLSLIFTLKAGYWLTLFQIWKAPRAHLAEIGGKWKSQLDFTDWFSSRYSPGRSEIVTLSWNWTLTRAARAEEFKICVVRCSYRLVFRICRFLFKSFFIYVTLHLLFIQFLVGLIAVSHGRNPRKLQIPLLWLMTLEATGAKVTVRFFKTVLSECPFWKINSICQPISS